MKSFSHDRFEEVSTQKKFTEVFDKYKILIKILKEAGVRTRHEITKIRVDHPMVKHNLHFIGDKLYETNAINIVIHVDGNRLRIKTTDYFKTYDFEWDQEV